MIIYFFIIYLLLLSSPKHFYIGLSPLKIISLYVTMVSLTTFSSSSMDIKFRWDIFNSFAFSSNFVLLIYFLLLQARLQKYSCLFFTTQNIHHHHHSICSIDGFLNQCIYTLQNTPEDDSFYFVCIQRQSLTLLHCNTCRMKHLENSS